MKLQRLAVLVFSGLVPLLLPSTASARVYVRIGPPDPVIEVHNTPPSAHHVWIAGHHRWSHHRYVWVPGHWAVVPRHRRVWRDGHWEHDRRGWYWVEGRWER